jgi:hypothetical protein
MHEYIGPHVNENILIEIYFKVMTKPSLCLNVITVYLESI